MSIRFNADEVFEIAEQIERNGARWYRMVADNAATADSKDVLLSLAAMEDQHLARFSDMRRELTAAERKPITFDPEGDAVLYLQAMADGSVFDMRADPTTKLTGNETLEDVLRTAISMENESILFYLGMKESVPPDLGGARLEGIIKEEMGHVVTLSRRLAAARFPAR